MSLAIDAPKLLTVEEAIERAGGRPGRTKAYEQIREQNAFLGVKVLRVGRKVYVPCQALDKVLGHVEADKASDDAMSTKSDTRRTYTVEEWSAMLGIHPNTAREHARKHGHIFGAPVLKQGRRILIPQQAARMVLEEINESPNEHGTSLIESDTLPDRTAKTDVSVIVDTSRIQGILDSWRDDIDAYLRSKAEGNIYFLQGLETGLIKIGLSTSDVEERIKAIRAMSPDQLRLLRVLPGGHSMEAFFHQTFKQARQHGEWFKPTPELLEFIDSTFDLDTRLPWCKRSEKRLYT